MSIHPPHLVPLELFQTRTWSMAGGNLVDSTDSRWGELVSSLMPPGVRCCSAVDVHDRVENQSRSYV